uniref:Uncharacterized protein n=1 Tax=Tetradesmus obliquus TaxID=3088 RepID=A0A383VTA3_TETOB|eukprot:jgi/Sobl393_1/5161/SZX67994.1
MQQIPLAHKRPVGLGVSCSPLQAKAVPCRPLLQRVRRCAVAAAGSGPLSPSAIRNDGKQQQQRGDLQVAGAAADYPYNPQQPSYNPSSFGGPDSTGKLGEAARSSLSKATQAMSRYGWIGFWVQLTLSVVSGVILLFSVAFTSQSGPKASLYLTLVGILAGFLSTFWSFGYQRLASRMQEYLDGANVAKIKKQQVMEQITRGILINIVGMGSTLLGISTLVGLLVAKTLSNASVNPFMASAAAGYNPVLALDVFLVQAATNTLLGHFLSLLCSLWLLNIVGEGRGLRFQRQRHMQKIKGDEDGPGSSLIGGTVKGFAGIYDIPTALGKGGRGGAGGSGRPGGDSYKTRAAAAAAAGASTPAGMSSSSLPNQPQKFAGGGYSSSSSSSGVSRATASSMPVVAAAAAAAAAAAPAASANAGSSAAVLPAASTAAPAALSAAAAAAAAPAAVTAAFQSFQAWRGNLAAWRAAAAPAAAAAATNAQALAAAGLAAPPVRVPSEPMQRLNQDFLLMPSESSLTYLDGALPGDFGFDPLGLFDPQVTSQAERTWLVTSEVIHGRWAMLGAVGCLVPELLGQQPFFATGWLPPAGAGPRYWADPYTLCGIQVALLGSAEWLRWRDYQQPGSMAAPLQPLLPQRADLAGGFAGSGAPAYPSGVFNCFAYVVSGPAIAQYKESEIRHGRLAMLAVAGFCAQAVLSGQGPWACLAAHLQSPLAANIFTSFGTVLGQ